MKKKKSKQANSLATATLAMAPLERSWMFIYFLRSLSLALSAYAMISLEFPACLAFSALDLILLPLLKQLADSTSNRRRWLLPDLVMPSR